MKSAVHWSPELDQLKRQWASMPGDFAGEADHDAEDAAVGAQVAIRTAYAQHWKTGNLAKRVVAARRKKPGRVTTSAWAGWAVKSWAPHTWMFEHGTKERSYITKPGKTPGSGGKVHRTGRMWKGNVPAPTFFPIANRFRRVFELRLIAMIRRAGAQVTESADLTGA